MTMPRHERSGPVPPPRPGWRDWAACAGADPDLFDGLDRWQSAVAWCLDCLVQGDCLADGLAAGDHEVIRGGMWLTWSRKRGHGTTPLICPSCHQAPVRTGRDGKPGEICGHRCPGGPMLVRRPSR